MKVLSDFQKNERRKLNGRVGQGTVRNSGNAGVNSPAAQRKAVIDTVGG